MIHMMMIGIICQACLLPLLVLKKNVKNGIFLHEVEKFELDLLLSPFTSHVQKLFAEP